MRVYIHRSDPRRAIVRETGDPEPNGDYMHLTRDVARVWRKVKVVDSSTFYMFFAAETHARLSAGR